MEVVPEKRNGLRKEVLKSEGVSFGGGYGCSWWEPFRWWNPTHWFAIKRNATGENDG